MRRFLISLTLVVAALAVVLMSCRAAISRPVLFPAPKFKITPELPGGEIVTVTGERTAYGYYAKGGKKLIVFFHGNGEVMGSMSDVAGEMLRDGFSVLMAEYPGYGYAAEFKASEQNIYEDAAALLKLMREKYGHSAADTILWGFSLGSAVAVEMAAQKQGERVILMAPFTSAGDTAAHHLFFGARWLIVDDFKSAAKAPAIHYPVLIVHGERDSVIPFRMGKELASLFPRAEFIPVAGADHNDLFMYLGASRWEQIRRFARGQ
jgi:alpha-beta hydrolase superfamily lysophospholipase